MWGLGPVVNWSSWQSSSEAVVEEVCGGRHHRANSKGECRSQLARPSTHPEQCFGRDLHSKNVVFGEVRAFTWLQAPATITGCQTQHFFLPRSVSMQPIREHWRFVSVVINTTGNFLLLWKFEWLEHSQIKKYFLSNLMMKENPLWKKFAHALVCITSCFLSFVFKGHAALLFRLLKVLAKWMEWDMLFAYWFVLYGNYFDEFLPY